MIFEKYRKSPLMDAATDISGGSEPAANNEGIAEPQPDNDTPPVEPDQPTEPAEPPQQPDVTQTQAFAHRLKEEKQKTEDAVYDSLYGAEYGIHSKAEYEAYMARQKAIEEGKDPEVVDLRNDLNTTKSQLQEFQFKETVNTQRTALSNDPKYGEVFKAWEGELNNRMQQYDQYFKSGQIQQRVDLETAFTLMWREKGPDEIATLKQKLDIEKANKANAASSTGSVTGQGNVPNGFFSKEQVEKMNEKQVYDNYDAIMASMKNW
jgi:hypothetical protein